MTPSSIPAHPGDPVPSSPLFSASLPSTATAEGLLRIRSPRLRLVVRLIWFLLMAVAVLVTVVSIPAYIQTCNCQPEIVATWESLGIASGVRLVFVTLTAANMLILLVLSSLIVWRRPDDAMAMFVSIMSLIHGVFLVAGPAGSSAGWYQAVRLIDNILTPLSWIALFFLFPDGHFFPKWSRYLLLALVIGMVTTAFLPAQPEVLRKVAGYGVAGLGLLSLAVGLWALVTRYRRMATSDQRQQIKGTLFALVAMVTILVIALPVQGLIRAPVPLAIYVIFRHILLAIAQMLVPVSMMVAMLRYRLWSIDLAINRAVVSALVTLTLAAAFILQFVLIQTLLTSLLGMDQMYVAVALPAALTALLFNPTRKRVRTWVDRQLYGFRFDLNQLQEAQHEPPITNRGWMSERTLGAYKLLDLIGRGGMGEVYKGFGNNRVVAVKLLHHYETQDQPELTVRFEREAQTLTGLDHPGIVRCYDYGVTPEAYYLVMELLEGQDLSAVIQQRGRLSLSETLMILQPLAGALDYAHHTGLVHRDIKPSNVMLVNEVEGFRTVLTDFGIAKIQDGKTSITGSGAIGTIDYMSPEQIMSASTVDHRTDLYALGIMLYQMLTGETPFKGSAGQVLFAHLQQPPADPRRLNPEIPSHIAHAVLRALAKKPEDRFQTAGELLEAMTDELAVYAA